MLKTKSPTFEYLNPVTHKEHKLWRFRSGYGISAIRGPNISGSDGKTWSVAVIKFYGPTAAEFNIDYENPLSSKLNDVFKFTPEEQLPSLVQLAEKLSNICTINN